MKYSFLVFMSFMVACGSGGNGAGTAPSGLGTSTETKDDENPDVISDGAYPILDLGDALALALVESDAASLNEDVSPLKKVTADGKLKPVITSGSFRVQKFMVAPGDKVYALLAEQQAINEAGDLCMLVEVNTKDDSLSCIELGDNFQVDWMENSKPIQFDAAGNLYYKGYINGKSILRKYSAGLVTDIINDNISISQYIVTKDGSIFLRGSTQSSGASWLRKLTTSGSLQNILTSSVNFLDVFPDGNLYFGVWTGSDFGVKRYKVSESVLDTTYYLAGDINGIATTKDIDVASSEYCGNETFRAKATQFCNYYGANAGSFFKTTSGSVYALLGWGADSTFMKYYPSISVPDISIKKVSIGKALVNSVILAGLGSANENKLILFDTSNGLETDILKQEDIEIYHVSYSSTENAILFDGLRFSDNKYVIGRYDIENGEMTASPISQKLGAYESL